MADANRFPSRHESERSTNLIGLGSAAEFVRSEPSPESPFERSVELVGRQVVRKYRHYFALACRRASVVSRSLELYPSSVLELRLDPLHPPAAPDRRRAVSGLRSSPRTATEMHLAWYHQKIRMSEDWGDSQRRRIRTAVVVE